MKKIDQVQLNFMYAPQIINKLNIDGIQFNIRNIDLGYAFSIAVKMLVKKLVPC